MARCKRNIYIKEVRKCEERQRKTKKREQKRKMRQTKTRQKDKEKENEINEVRQMRRKTERFRK